MNLFLFGKKRRVSKKKKSVKRPPKRLLRLCKKYGIKTTIKRGKKRVYKKVSVLKKLIKMKRKKVVKKSKRKSPRRKMTRRRMYFGESIGFPYSKPEKYGYDQKVVQATPTLSQNISNLNRPDNFKINKASLGPDGINGVYRDFFGEKIPTMVGPNYYCMGQPNGECVPVGLPFYKNTDFGRCRRTKRKMRKYH